MNILERLYKKSDESLEKPLDIETLESSKNKLVFGKLYASWCGHCVRLAEIWPNIIDKINASRENLLELSIESENMESEIEKINGTILKDSPNKLALQEGYPTIFKIENGKLSYYNGPREVDPMVAWCLASNRDKFRRRKINRRKSKRPRRKTNVRKTIRRR